MSGNKDVTEKFSDSDVEILIGLWWKNERALWVVRDVTFPKYSNTYERKTALSRISHKMDDLDTPVTNSMSMCNS